MTEKQSQGNRLAKIAAAAGIGLVPGFVVGTIRSLVIPTSLRSILEQGELEKIASPKDFGGDRAAFLACRGAEYAMYALTHGIVAYEILRIIAGQGADTASAKFMAPFYVTTNAISLGYEIYRLAKRAIRNPASQLPT